jgi:hypothetical protein
MFPGQTSIGSFPRGFMAIHFDTLLTVGQERFNPAGKDRVGIFIREF